MSVKLQEIYKQLINNIKMVTYSPFKFINKRNFIFEKNLRNNVYKSLQIISIHLGKKLIFQIISSRKYKEKIITTLLFYIYIINIIKYYIIYYINS